MRIAIFTYHLLLTIQMTKKFTYAVLVIVLCLLVEENAFSQQRFSAGVIGGLTASQIDGDDSAGFNKVGLTGGLKATTFLTDKMDISFEILFSQRGSVDEIDLNNAFVQQKLHLNYVEVPVIFGYNDWYDEELEFYHLQFQVGGSYGRLINSKFNEGTWDTGIIENLNENNVSWLVGATYFLNPNIGFSFRYNSGITLLFNTNNFPALNAKSLRSRYLSLHTLYMF